MLRDLLVLQTLIGSYNSAVTRLGLKVEQLEGDVDLVRADLSQLTDKVSEGNVLQIIKQKPHQRFRRMAPISLNINRIYYIFTVCIIF